MAFLGVGGPETGAEKTPPPVNPFMMFIDNFVNQVTKSPTGQLAETARIGIDKLSDDSAVLPQKIIDSWQSQIPNLKIPFGTRMATATVIRNDQMSANNLNVIENNPQNNGLLAYTGAILGGTDRYLLDPTVLGSALTGDGVGDLLLGAEEGGAVGAAVSGESLAGPSFLPEAPYVAQINPGTSTSLVRTGLIGGMFGVTDGLIKGSISAAQRKVVLDEGTPVGQVVRDSMKEGVTTALFAVGLHVASGAISEGMKLLSGKFDSNPDLDNELASRTEEENKNAFQKRVSQIQKNHKAAASGDSKEAQENIQNTFAKTKVAISKLKEREPENKRLDVLGSTVDEISKSDSPFNEKIDSIAKVKLELTQLSRKKGGFLNKDLKEINREINSYYSLAGAPVEDKLQSVLSDFRMVTPSDFTALTKIATAQMEDGRAADVEPYLNQLVFQNSQILNDRLDAAGFNRGKVLHAVLDSLDVIKEREKNIEETVGNARDLLKETVDPEERNLIKGVIAGRDELRRQATNQRAIHEILATAISKGFEPASDLSVTSYLKNQMSNDADFIGGYQELSDELLGDAPSEALAKVEGEPEAFTPEGVEEAKKIKIRKNLAPKMSEAAVKCLLGE